MTHPKTDSLFSFILILLLIIPHTFYCMEHSTPLEDAAQSAISRVRELCLQHKNPLECLHEIDSILNPNQEPFHMQKFLLAQPEFVALLQKVLVLIKEFTNGSSISTLHQVKSIINRFSPLMSLLLKQRLIAHNENQFDAKKRRVINHEALYAVQNQQMRTLKTEEIKFLPDDTCVVLQKKVHIPNADRDSSHRVDQTFQKDILGDWSLLSASKFKAAKTMRYLLNWTIYERNYSERRSKEIATLDISEIKEWWWLGDGNLLKQLSHNGKVVAIVAGASGPYRDEEYKTKLHIWLWDVDRSFYTKAYEDRLFYSFFDQPKLPEITLWQVIFSRDDRVLFISTSFGYLLFNIEKKAVIRKYFNMENREYFSGTFTRDGLFLILMCNNARTLEFLEVQTGKVFYSQSLPVPRGDLFMHLRISHDELTFAFLSDRHLIIETKLDNLRHLFFKLLLARHMQLQFSKRSKKPLSQTLLTKHLARNISLSAQRKRSVLDNTERTSEPIHIAPSNKSTMALQPLQASQNQYWCLAINGEGTDTIVCAAMLKKIEEITQCQIRDLFDCIVASSCASPLAIAIATCEENNRPLLTAAQFIDLLSTYSDTKDATKKYGLFLNRFRRSTRLSDCLTRVLVPYTEYTITGQDPKLTSLHKKDTKVDSKSSTLSPRHPNAPLSDPRPSAFDSYAAQMNEANNCYIEYVVRSTCGDGDFLPCYLTRQNNTDLLRSSSATYKNNSVQFLYDTLFRGKDSKQMYVLSLSTGVINENNAITDKLLKKELETSHYTNIKPKIKVTSQQKVTSSELADLIKSGETAIDNNKETILRIKQATKEKSVINP